MDEISHVAARLRASSGLAGTLTAGFDAFEAIRAAARGCEDRAPDLLPAFMLAAGAAVEGRNAVAAAPSLPPADTAAGPPGVRSPDEDAEQAADALAALGELLAGSLSAASALAARPGDVAACGTAAQAAREIHRLLGRAGDDI
jgi:hypothetical protein